MDWNAAVDKNREALKRVLAMLVAMAGLGGEFAFLAREVAAAPGPRPEKGKLAPALTLPRHLYRFLLRLLRPAEAAARRLIIVAARGLALPPLRPRKPRRVIVRKAGRAGRPPRNIVQCVLPLLDPLPRWRRRLGRPAPGRGVPRISFPGFSLPAPLPPPPSSDDPINATRLALRLQALAAALDDLPGQAKRFARWRARREAAQDRHDAQRPRRLRPLRPGRPPGWRRKPLHEVHEVLDVVHGLAFWVLSSPDTS